MSTSTLDRPTATAEPEDERHALVKVRFRGERRFFFLAGNGRVTSKRIRAVTHANRASAIRDADRMIEPGTDVVAACVMQGGRRVYLTGEATPPAAPPKYGPEAGYRYLVSVTKTGRGVFEVRDEGGRWGRFDEATYELCAEEKRRAGLTARGMNVHAATATIFTDSVKFTQRSVPAAFAHAA